METISEFIITVELESKNSSDVIEKLYDFKGDRSSLEYHAEHAAFSVSYYGFSDDINAGLEEYEYNQIADSDQFADYIAYWDMRRKQTTNQLFRFIYSNILWSFKKDPETKVSIEDVITDIAVSAIKVSQSDKLNIGLYMKMSYLSTALNIAWSAKKDELVKDLVCEIMGYCNIQYYGKNLNAWYTVFSHLLKKHSDFKLSEDQVDNIISLLSNIMSMLIRPQDILRILDVLAYYYHSNNDSESIFNIFDLAYKYIENSVSSGLGFVAVYHVLYDLAEKHKYQKMTFRITEKMGNMGRLIKEEMKPHEIPFSDKTEQLIHEWQNRVKAAVHVMLEENDFILVLNDILFINIPDIKNYYEIHNKKLPLHELFHITQFSVDEDGVPVTTNMVDLDETSKMIACFMEYNFKFDVCEFAFIMNELFTQCPDSEKEIIELIHMSNNLTDETKEIVVKGISMFFLQDYTTSVFLLVPLFEDILRNLVSKLGGNIRKRNRFTGGFDKINLEAVLKHEELKKIFNDSEILFFKSILSNRYGLNLRNSLCHGLVKKFDYIIAIVVLQIALMITMAEFPNIQ